jgi:hypothetical protein
MGRFILRYTGSGAVPTSDIEHIESMPGVTVIEKASPRMLLVQSPPEAISKLQNALPNWKSWAEQMIPLPDTRRNVRGK